MRQHYTLLDMRTREHVAHLVADNDTDAAQVASTWSTANQRLVAMLVQYKPTKVSKRRRNKAKHEPPIQE